MAPKGHPLSKWSPKKNKKKNQPPKSNYHIKSEEINESSGDFVEYPMKRKVEPKEK